LEQPSEKTFDGSSGPKVKMFKRFRDQWGFIDKERFQAAGSDSFAQNAVADVR